MTRLRVARLVTAAAAAATAAAATAAAPTPPPLPLVPLPASVDLGAGARVALSPTLALAGNGAAVPTLAAAFARFRQGALPQYRGGGTGAGGCAAGGWPAASTLTLSVANASEAPPQLGDDESYTLSVSDAGAIAAGCARVAGCLHALTTLGQLVAYGALAAGGCYTVPTATVSDAPRFAHRGLLLDAARHWYAVPTLHALLDAMAAVKLNALHWHLADDQSFPLVLPGAEELAGDGAFPPGAPGAPPVYTPGDVADVVAYAAARGIRVVPELDAPGHSASWCVSHPEACITCPPGSSSAPAALDPSANATLPLVAAAYRGLRALFPDAVAHAGGDEIDLGCWVANPRLAAWLAARHPGLPLLQAAAAEAYGVFVPAVHAAARAAGFTRLTAWEDAFDFTAASSACGNVTPPLSNASGVAVQVFRAGWAPGRGPATCGANTSVTAAAAAGAGFDVIWAPPMSWYLTCYADACDASGGGAGWQPWADVYAAPDVFDAVTDPAARARVLGGEATLWSERLDGASLLGVAFPRAAAVAEVLWSPWEGDGGGAPRNATAAAPRHAALRALLLARGVAASSVAGGNEASAWGLPSRPAGPGLP